MPPNMRISLQAAQLHVRAEIRDFLLSLEKGKWKDEVKDEPGLTEFAFSDSWGPLGTLRIYEIHAGQTVFTAVPPVEASEPETISLLLTGEIFVTVEEWRKIEPVLKAFAAVQEQGISPWKVTNLFQYLMYAANDKQEFTTEEWNAVKGILEQSGEKDLLHRQKKHSWIIDQIVCDLRRQGLWNPVGQEAGLNQPKLSTYNEESPALTAGPAGTEVTPENLKSKRGPKSGSPEEKRAVVDEWLRVQNNETQIAFCLRKNISASTLRNWRNRV